MTIDASGFKFKRYSIAKSVINHKFASYILKTLGKYVLFLNYDKYDIELYLKSDTLTLVTFFFKHHVYIQANLLVDIVASDHLKRSPRFRVVYNLLSAFNNTRYRITVGIRENKPLRSVSSLFYGSTWQEREVWDMFGIFFTGHPDLRRILTDYGFRGHPLRKDFPVTGFLEVVYSDIVKFVNYRPVVLSQELRIFSTRNPWVKIA